MLEKYKEKFHSRTKDSVKNISFLKQLLSKRLANFLIDRKANQANLSLDFELVLQAWGLSSWQIPLVCKDLKSRIFLYIPIFLIASILILQGFFFLGILLYLCTFIGISTTTWRISILQKKQFISYKKYLLRRIYENI